MARHEIWPDIERVFNEAVELEPADRLAFLEKSCLGNEELRHEVESLLAQADKRGLLGHQALDAAAPMVSEIERQSWRLSPGMRLGVYEITSAIGAGGMAEVYKARDRKLHRDVAIKVLPENFAHDRERLARLHREAQLLASLNHPRIAAIYGLEEHDGVCGLVLEFVDGETLAERIARGRVPLEEALEFVRQIAEALNAAHAKGVVHRDLKPANIKIASDGTVKVLDFGLAKIFEPQLSAANVPSAANVSTDRNVLLGTAAYMSPEQARGKDVDKRTDIWAWGCVLYEMLAGRRAFDGDTATDVIAKLVAEEPDWSKLPGNIPLSVRTVLQRALQKDPNRRIHDIADARIEIDEAMNEPVREAGSVPTSRRREYLAWGAMLVAAIFVVAVLYLRPAPLAPSEVRLDLATPAGEGTLVENLEDFAISPDGSKVVFRAIVGGKQQLWLRSLESEQSRVLEGTEGAVGPPIWSPDGASIGFYTPSGTAGRPGTLKGIDVTGGNARTLVVADFLGATWGRGGTILFARGSSSSIFRIPQTGGEPVEVTRLEPQQSSHRYPWFLPDGRRFLFFATGTPDVQGIYAGSLDSQHTQRLFAADSKPVFAPPDNVLFEREGTLLAQRLSLDSLKPIGEPFAVAERISVNPYVFGMGAFSAAASGTLAYRAAVPQKRQWTLVDRSGKQIATVGEPDYSLWYGDGRFSRDGQTLAYVRNVNGNRDIWYLDVAQGSRERLTINPSADGEPVWSPDGDRIAFHSSRRKGGGNYDLYEKPISGSERNELSLLETVDNVNMQDWSPDGRFILYTDQRPQHVDRDLWVLSRADRKQTPIAQSDFQENRGRFSPDGRWIAYVSNKTGRSEVYVQSLSGSGRAVPISLNGGENPRWNPKGGEVFYVGPGSRVMAVSLTLNSNGTLKTGALIPLFILRHETDFADVAPDGQRFLLNVALDEPRASPITVILNWQAQLKK